MLTKSNSLARKNFVKALSKSTSIKDACVKAGVSNRMAYKNEEIRKLIHRFIVVKEHNLQAIIEKFQIIADVAIMKGDLTNANRSMENLANIGGLFKSGVVNEHHITFTPQENAEYTEILTIVKRAPVLAEVSDSVKVIDTKLPHSDPTRVKGNSGRPPYKITHQSHD